MRGIRIGGSGVFSLLAAVLGASLLAGCEGDRGPMGGMGAPGTPGAPGAPGAPGTPGADGADAGTPPVAACTPGTLPAGLPASAIALTTTGKLVRFQPGASSGGNVLFVLGLAPGESLVGIDFRPSDGALIGVTKNGTAGSLVRIDRATGEVTRLAKTQGATALTLSGTRYGVDFNPVPGALRIVGDNEENYRLTFSGTNLLSYTVFADTALNPVGNVVGAGYTNNFAGTPVTTLYALDSASDSLVLQGGIDGTPSPNAGALNTVGVTGVAFEDTADLDIDGVSGVALATLNLAGAVSTGVYAIDLGTGAATCVGTVPAPEGELAVDIAIGTPDPAIAYGLTTGNGLVTFTPNAAGVASVTGPVAISGLGASDVPVGIDIRPRTGVLTLVTRDTAAGSLGRVWEVDPVTGAATQVAANGAAVDFDDASADADFGVDFNPVPNALRIVNRADQNFRLTFPAGFAGYDLFTDGAIKPAGSMVASGDSSAAAYTNSFDGATATRLYVIDTVSSQLLFQNPPNNGEQTVVGTNLGITAVDNNSGFDIVGGAGVTAAGVNLGNTVSFAALTVGGASNLYRINLQSGTATQIGAGPIGGASPQALKGLAVRVRK